jgi:hypothetical protein
MDVPGELNVRGYGARDSSNSIKAQTSHLSRAGSEKIQPNLGSYPQPSSSSNMPILTSYLNSRSSSSSALDTKQGVHSTAMDQDSRRRFSRLAFEDVTKPYNTVTPVDLGKVVESPHAEAVHAWKSPVSQPINNRDIVVIHVSDEAKNINRDFYCRKDLLVKHMKYFESYLDDGEQGYEEIDISVNCDVEIFEWLMNYIHDQDSPPAIHKTIVVSILISSDFLQMGALVDTCLAFFAANLNEIIKLPIDLSCLSERLIHRLALLTSPKVS